MPFKLNLYLPLFLPLLLLGCPGQIPDGAGCADAIQELGFDNPAAISPKDLGCWPLATDGRPTSTMADPYGPRILGSRYDFHRGIDLQQPLGTPVYAITAGQVVLALSTQPGDDNDKLGKYVVIAHEDENGEPFQTKYQHLDSYSVQEGDELAQGEQLGTVGNSGDGIDTVHLHFGLSMGRNDGVFSRVTSRNPLHILPYEQGEKQMVISRTDDTLSFALGQEPTSIDIVRWVITPEGHPPKVLGWESREGMDKDDDDTNPFENIEVIPESFRVATELYQVRVDYSGDWAGLNSCSLTLYDVRGRTYEFDQQF